MGGSFIPANAFVNSVFSGSAAWMTWQRILHTAAGKRHTPNVTRIRLPIKT